MARPSPLNNYRRTTEGVCGIGWCVLALQSQSLVSVVAQISGIMCARIDLRLSTTRVEPESIRLQIQPKRGMPCG
jgi:hypothetical protein